MPSPEHPSTDRDLAPAVADDPHRKADIGPRPIPAQGPRLPSRRTTAVLAGVVLIASIGLGAALPGGKSGSVALGADSPLTASLLGAVAADQKALDRPPTPQTSEQASQVSGEEKPQTSQQETGNERGPGAKAQESAQQETGLETEGAGSEGTGSPGAGESAGGPSGARESPGSSKSKAGAPVSPALLAQITHVWVISLSGSSFTAALRDPAVDPYLARQLLPKGVLLTHYALVGSSSAANEIALLSGQAPNAETQRDCPTYAAVTPTSVDAKGLAGGSGCVYPAAAKTLADQASEAALTWRAYLQDMAPASGSPGAGQSAPSQNSASSAGAEAGPGAAAGQPATPEATCRHPQPGNSESTTPPTAGNDYLVSRNPFVYFDSLLESQACAKDDVDLSRLSADLATPAQTPNLSWIVPSACDDGSQTSCGAGSNTGLAAADAFLGKVMPQILATAAYREHGMVIVDFDEGSSAQSDAQVGALVLSPFVRSGVKVAEPLTTYSLLKSLDRLFGVPLLGHAADQGVTELDAQVYRTASNTTLVRANPRRGPSQTGG